MMKVVSNTTRTSAHNNGNLASNSRYTARKIAADHSKKKGEPKVTSESEILKISTLRHVLRDKTNNLTPDVKSSVYTPVGTQKSEKNRLRPITDPFIMSRRNLSNSFSFNQKQTKDTMKKSETSQNEPIADVYEFVLDEGEVNENELKIKKKRKRKHVQRKIINSPEEVLPIKKIRKPLQDSVSKNLIPETNLKNRLENKELTLSSAKSVSNVLPTTKMKMKSVHFNNLSGGDMIKSHSGMQMKLCIPKCSSKSVSSPLNIQVLKTHTEANGKDGTPNLSTSLNSSLRVKSVRSSTTEKNQVLSPSVSECDRQDLRTKGNELPRKLLSFFSPMHATGNSGNSYSIVVTEKTPAKQVAAQSRNADTGNTEISHSEDVQPFVPSVAAEQQCDKMEKSLDVSNYFGFDEDADSEDEEFSPAKTFTKSSHKLGKFQCSTPKGVGQKNGASQPFRFPNLSIVKKRKFLQIAGNTPTTATNLSGKTANERSGSTSKRKPCIPTSCPVKETSKPAIFDLEDEVQKYQDDEKFEGEQKQLQMTLKDRESVSSPQKKVVQKCYATPRHARRLKQPVYEEVEEGPSEDEAEEIVPKKHKKTHRPSKAKEADEWAKSFNSMCETIDGFELVVE